MRSGLCTAVPPNHMPFNVYLVREAEKKYLSLEDDLGLNWIVYYLKNNLKFYEIPISGKKRFNNPRFGNMIRANFKILSYLSRNLI